MPFKHPRLEPGYTSSPQKPTLYSGPDIPVAYDSDWQYFTNLTPDQIAWFQAQPEWADFKAWVALSGKAATINAWVSPATISSALAAANKITL